MNVGELIEELNKLPKNLSIRLVNCEPENDEENYWLTSVEASKTGESGYEVEGEVRIIGTE